MKRHKTQKVKKKKEKKRKKRNKPRVVFIKVDSAVWIDCGYKLD